MPHIPQQIDAPKSWDDFERLCCALFQQEWANQAVQGYGRKGQAQQGVDIIGPNRNDGGRWYGVQCKLKDGNLGGKLTKAEIDKEVVKVDALAVAEDGIKLAGFVIATTVPVDVALQKHCAKLTIKRQADGLCSVVLYGWEHIEGMIRSNGVCRGQVISDTSACLVPLPIQPPCVNYHGRKSLAEIFFLASSV